MNYKKLVSDISSLSFEKLREATNICITGNNMSGKSEILYEVIQLFMSHDEKDFYFIDTVNRTIFNNTTLPSVSKEDLLADMGDPSEICSRRLNEVYFNKIDTFQSGVHGEGSSLSYHFLRYYLDDPTFKDLLEMFLDEFNIDINIENDIILFTIEESEVIPSSGYQALLRLFIEVYYASLYNTKYLVIDEIDSHLDNNMCSKIMPLFRKLFPDIHILTTVHSLTFFEQLENTKIIVLNGSNEFKILDCKDLGSLEFIHREIFNKQIEYLEVAPSFVDQMYMKVFNDIDLTDKEIHLLKEMKNLSPNEKSTRNIILSEIEISE